MRISNHLCTAALGDYNYTRILCQYPSANRYIELAGHCIAKYSRHSLMVAVSQRHRTSPWKCQMAYSITSKKTPKNRAYLLIRAYYITCTYLLLNIVIMLRNTGRHITAVKMPKTAPFCWIGGRVSLQILPIVIRWCSKNRSMSAHLLHCFVLRYSTVI